MNYRYKIDDLEVVLNPEEHGKVNEAIRSGKSICFLRNGTLAVNINFIRYVKETDQPTDHQLTMFDKQLSETGSAKQIAPPVNTNWEKSFTNFSQSLKVKMKW